MESLTEEKSERMRIDELNGWSSDRWRTRSDNVVSAKSKGNEERGAGFYRWSARKTKRHFNPRYEPFDEWHMSCALNASAACQTSIALTASYSINHSPKGPRHRQLYSSDRPYWLCHHPLSIYNRHLSLNFSSFTSISHPSPHEHWTVRIVFTVTPIGPLA